MNAAVRRKMPNKWGISLAEELLNNGAREILAEVYNGDARHEYPCHPPVSRWRRVSEPSATGAGGLAFSTD
ncbi:hypothetical protein ACLK1T_11760 [Escherichia coli]